MAGRRRPDLSPGSKLLAWLAPEPTGPVEEVPVTEPIHRPLADEDGIWGRRFVVEQLAQARSIIDRHAPDALAVLGGDCLVSLAPLSWLAERHGDRLGILWIDAHPDVQTPAQYGNAHAHVLAALMGIGDPDLTGKIGHPVPACNIMIVGMHAPSEYEAGFIAENGIRTCSPEEVRAGAEPVLRWLEDSGIEVLAIHFDLDVLDPANFRSVLFARPGRGEDDFGNVAEGRLAIADVVGLIGLATGRKPAVGITIAEHLPWDAVHIRDMLRQLPLLG